MKKGLCGLPAILLFTGMLSCSRHASSPGNDCISDYVAPAGATISSAQLDSTYNLFSKNNLSRTRILPPTRTSNHSVKSS